MNIKEKVGFSCTSWVGPCELTYEVVSKNSAPIELVSCYLKNYRWVLYLRDYDQDGHVESLTIVKDLKPFMISRSKNGAVFYDKNSFTQEQAKQKLQIADRLWKQALTLLKVPKQLQQHGYV